MAKTTSSVAEEQEVEKAVSTTTSEEIPELVDWETPAGYEFYTYENGVVKARYDRLGMKDTPLQVYYIEKAHYKSRMPDIVHHLNYFLTFYDKERESFLSMLSVKYLVDTQKDMSQKEFIQLMLDRVITKNFIQKCKAMATALYQVNVNTDPEGKYRNSPKITNDQARQICAISFCFRFILPLCIHFSNVSSCFMMKDRYGKMKRGSYLECFDRLFSKIIQRFEKDDVEIYTTLCQFIVHRAEKHAQNNKTIFSQKEMIRGDIIELYIEAIIHDVILVKSLYKLDYTKSCVSFFDGIVSSYGMNYNIENYASKPTEIDSPDTTKDSDDHPSHAEALEMQVYKLDESNPMINDVNRYKVMKGLRTHMEAVGISQEAEDYKFYYDNLRFTEISDYLLHSFYSPMFTDPYAVHNLSRAERVELQMYLKKFLEIRGMPLLAQISTAVVKGHYKENPVKNAKFDEMISTDPIYEQILSSKFRYIREFDAKSDPIRNKMSAIINCTFEFVDPDPQINGFVVDDINIDTFRSEFLLFLSII